MASVNISSFFGCGSSGGGSGGGLYNQFNRNTSGTFTVPVDGNYLITGIGGGGCGCYGYGGGGGAGGLAQSLVTLSAGDVITFVIGAGGASMAAGLRDGLPGGTTTVTGPGLSLTANGGGAGINQTNGSAGGAGGTASGGNVMNNTGGAGGNQTFSGANETCGGGAVGLYGTGFAGSNYGQGGGVGSAPGLVASWAAAVEKYGRSLAMDTIRLRSDRLLQPYGVFQGEPGVGFGNSGASSADLYAYDNGRNIFAGGGDYGGRFGGGAGSANGLPGVVRGGVGGVIIEWFQ